MNITQVTCVICATILVLADKSPWIWVWFLIYGAVSMINFVALTLPRPLDR